MGERELIEELDLQLSYADLSVALEDAIIAVRNRLAALASRPAVAEGWVLVPVTPTREMLNAAIDVDSFKLGDISPLGFRCSPQMLFERCYAALLSAAPKP